MEHAPGDDGVVRAVDLLESRPAEERPVGRLRIDADDLVPGRPERLDEAALASAADLEHSSWRRRQLV